jgi:hypothetical protein
MKQTVAQKNKRKLRTQINVKFNYISNGDENKKNHPRAFIQKL